jgi:hypothetical protein
MRAVFCRFNCGESYATNCITLSLRQVEQIGFLYFAKMVDAPGFLKYIIYHGKCNTQKYHILMKLCTIIGP